MFEIIFLEVHIFNVCAIINQNCCIIWFLIISSLIQNKYDILDKVEEYLLNHSILYLSILKL